MTILDIDKAMHQLMRLAEMDWAELFRQQDVPEYGALARAVEHLGKHSSTDREHLSRIERARVAWAVYVAGGRAVGRADMLALCWDCAVAREAHFLAALKQCQPLRSRALRGLMSSYHEAWSPALSEMAKVIGETLAMTQRYRAPIDAWVACVGELVGPDASRRFAAACERERTSVSARLERLGLARSGAFAEAAAGELALLATAPNITIEQLAYALNCTFPEDNLLIPGDRWGDAYARLVLNERLLRQGGDRQRLIDLALKTRGLDNPCLSTVGWSSVPEQARRQVMLWLSEEHLRLFFDLIMEGQPDPQRRRSFWMEYIGKVQRSAVVVGERDFRRLELKLDEMRQRGRFHARMRGAGGGNAHVSAFIMDFGRVIVVEFSRINSACYFYRNEGREPYLDLARNGFDWSELKNTRAAIRYLAHVPPPEDGWYRLFRQELARYGIRS